VSSEMNRFQNGESAKNSADTRGLLRLTRTAWLAATLALTATLAIAGCSSSKAAKSAGSAPSGNVTQSTSTTQATTSEASSTLPSSSAVGALSGAWTGDYRSSAGDDTGTIKATFAQAGATISGAITTDSVCFRQGTLSGTLAGTTITLIATQGSQTLTFTGSLNSPTGRNIQGTYKAVTTCGNGSGTFELGHTSAG
jgi:hypothetical protein